MCRYQRLSRQMGVSEFSEANTQSSGPGPTNAIHSFSRPAVMGGISTARLEESVRQLEARVVELENLLNELTS